ncbi:MAG TPA: hypothetical protein PK325_14450 [Cyclobacteriaceae bacterium]|nr:hypothetical protein [Cyclobacteriaceae bacterium]HMV08459.1 hypothetical protein [Cyclobacteriaceae bacterium]HMV89170.1 hypothetical protein [Cyclobacteriaceae bacterium]HMX01232.1 hypothetical protein [Cyclobacteriaceae bacterium]HMX50635.1 hypothetical protein [Cyclobacteriaceae bacterium]
MIKNLTIYTLLLSMALHCACRLGVLDHLYERRHQIAFSVGLLAEVPIAVCGHKYDPGTSLKINTQQQHAPLPSTVFQSQEIKLFFTSAELSVHPDYYLLTSNGWRDCGATEYPSPDVSIFHPPSLIS